MKHCNVSSGKILFVNNLDFCLSIFFFNGGMEAGCCP